MQPTPHIRSIIDIFTASKQAVLDKWVAYDVARDVLQRHDIESGFFTGNYGSGVYDYFEKVIRGEREIGNCPAIAELLDYLKDHDISADELFLLCSHFRRAMVDISYELGVNSQEVYDEISYVFDLNFAGVLKRYTETIYQKDREIERNVKLLEEYRRAIDESAIVAKTDAGGIITYANEKLSRVCGYSQAELVGSPHTLIYHPDMSERIFDAFWSKVKKNRVFKGTLKSLAKDGTTFYVDTTIVPITNTLDEVTEYIAISYEVTDLVVAKEDAIAASEAKEYFLSNMSHEIRTPLNAILGFVALLKDEATTDKERRYLDIISSSGENLLSIINDILDFSKLRSGEFTIEPKTFNLHRAITHTLELFMPSINQHHLTMTSFIDPRIPYELISDPLRIQQVISNLLSNAIKFTPAGGEIKVEASFVEDKISVSVIDNGVGIAARDQKHIFDPFSQAHSDEVLTKGGTGLGLSISAQLVRHMGGDIFVQSRPGIGSTFTFTLPVSVGGEKRPGLMDIARVQKLKLALLRVGDKRDTMSASLERYLNSFGVRLEEVETIDAEYDLLFFSDHQIDAARRRALIKSARPKVALMDAPYDTYDMTPTVTPLVMPLYCTKLQEVMETALGGGEPPQPALKTKPMHFSAHVLVAEDNEANRELIGTLLGNIGITYTFAENGAEAFKKMQLGGYDLVLMDEQMPVMSGRDAAKAMQRVEAKEGRGHLPVIALTANVLGNREHRSVYDDFLGKPIEMNALIASLTRFIKPSDATVLPGGTPETAVPLCFEALCETLQVTPAQLRTLLDVYREKMVLMLETLSDAIEQKDMKKIAFQAHSVKGSSSNFRFEAITQQAEQMEKEARAGNASFDYARLLGGIKEAFNALVAPEQ